MSKPILKIDLIASQQNFRQNNIVHLAEEKID